MDMIISLALVALGLFGAFSFGKRTERKDAETETRNQAIATQKRIDDAFSDRDGSSSAARDRLRDRAKR
jgi:type II secretory pathway component PulJ